MVNFSIQEIINKAVMPQEQKKKTSWWASDLGKCLRGVYYARQGVEPPVKLTERNYRVFQVGKMFEQWIIKIISEQGSGLKFEQPETLHIKDLDLSVRPDLIVEAEGQKILYEIKSVHSKKFWWMENKKEGPDEHYLMQTWTGLYATQINDGRLIYFSKDDLCVVEYGLKLDDENLKNKVFKELEILNKAWKEQIPPPAAEPIVNNKVNWLASYCSYHALCMNDPQWEEKAQKQCHTKK